MKDWHFNVLFFVAIGGTAFFVIAPTAGLTAIPDNPTGVGGVGVILAWVLNELRQRKDRDDDRGDGEGGGS